MFGNKAVFILTRENKEGYKSGYINEKFLEQNISDPDKHFYVCGPDQMISDLVKNLEKSGAKTDALIFEK